jgi:hypothetical protein
VVASALSRNTRSYKVGRVLHLYGVPVTPENARHLVATLIADGGPHALSAAGEIQKGLDRELYAVGLERQERDAILAVLEAPPEALLSSAECSLATSATEGSRAQRAGGTSRPARR